ncbi:VWA domain-containing protein [Roseiconus nitratireducens]|uniref:VWA domain-containing protein n=1 Tax=Roseiconus nitratireducens TaxID=2605748 RepID=A0A5M6DIL3_9BACT|nr:BatA domain-containing protein [Roseiconus nitratireducens]KAA5546216.1 VWA domain-containing protein [Roseiconus nitratireducens]
MSFLNAALAAGALAFTIPLIIHLFFRSRFKRVDWGAMHLLESVLRVNRRRMQITNWLLLLLRCAIPILLALCLARPVLTGFRALAGDAPKTLVIAVDDSRSMSVTPPGQPSRMQQAKAQLETILGDLSRRDEVILIRGSRPGAVATKMGVADASTALRKVTAQAGPVSIGQLIESAVAAASEATHARRQLLIVSDFQSDAVGTSSLETAQNVAESFRSDSESKLNRPVIDFLNVGGDSDTLSNVSIDSISVDSPVVVAGRSGVFAATIRNDSDLAARDLRLVWAIDGQPLEPRTVSIDPRSTATNRLTHTIPQSGMHRVTATIGKTDVLPSDNRRSVAVEVMREINVVLVDGRPSNQALQGQADFLAIALSPFAFGGDDRPDPVNATVVSERRLEKTLEETDARVVILADVGRLSESARDSLAQFVHSGGGLVVFDGPDVRPALYNQPWGKGPNEFRFAAPLGEVIGQTDRNQVDAAAAFTIDTPPRIYEPWRVLSTGEANPLSDVRVWAYRDWGSEESSSAKADDSLGGAMVLLKTNGGEPLAIKSAVGSGSVIQFAIPGNDSWTNFPLRPIFLPMIQQLVLELAGKRAEPAVDVGQPLVISQNDWPPLTKVTDPDARKSYWVQPPDGEESELQPENDNDSLRLTSTFTPGTYHFRKTAVSAGDAKQRESVHTLRIVEVPPSESVLVDVNEERLQKLTEALDASVYRTADSLRSADRTRSFGREIWRWLWAALVAALVAELWLQQNLVSRRASQEAAV